MTPKDTALCALIALVLFLGISLIAIKTGPAKSDKPTPVTVKELGKNDHGQVFVEIRYPDFPQWVRDNKHMYVRCLTEDRGMYTIVCEETTEEAGE